MSGIWLGGESGIGNPDRSAFGDLRISKFEPLTGWTFAYNLNPGIINQFTTGSGTVTTDCCSAVLSTGTDVNGRAKIETIRGSRYIPGVGGIARFTAVFDTPKADSIQIIGIGNGSDGWYFGFNGLQFGILRRSRGVDYWTYQADWNIDTKPNLDHNKGNVFEIRYQWLGYGMQYFSIENEQGTVSNVHVIRYANLYEHPSVDNPNLPLSALAENLGNNTDIQLRTPSAIAGLDGEVFNDALSTNVADDFIGEIPADTETPIIAFRMPETYYSKGNRLYCQALRLAFATEGNKPVIYRFYTDATVDGTFAFINEPVSPLQVNKTLTTFSGGNPLGTFGLGKSDSYPVDLIDSQFRLYAGQNVVVTAFSTGNSELVFGWNWKSFI